MRREYDYEIRDPVYGFIVFNDYEKEIINHPLFQRLRRIKQLGLTDMVYPGAVHTRFEHSLGVMHLATKMYDAITENKANVDLLENKKRFVFNEFALERDRQLVRLAALLHDVGHTPFSHAAEGIMPEKPDSKPKKKYSHEDYTVYFIKNLFKDKIEDETLSPYKISADEVADLISGEIKTKEIFWRELISSQLDADRGDYLLRDSHHCGVSYGLYDLEGLLVNLKVGIDPETNDLVLGIKKGGWHIAESLIIARYQMFSQVYFHKTRRAYNIMLEKALKKNIIKLEIPSKIKKSDYYCKLDDYNIWAKMAHSKDEFCKSIIDRNHLRMVDEKTVELLPKTDIETTEETLKRMLINQELIKKQKERIEKIKNKLGREGIETYPDEASKAWYELNSKDKLRDDFKPERVEPMIIKEDLFASPLSEYSKLVKTLGLGKTIVNRIYVKSSYVKRPEDKKKVENFIKEIENNE